MADLHHVIVSPGTGLRIEQKMALEILGGIASSARHGQHCAKHLFIEKAGNERREASPAVDLATASLPSSDPAKCAALNVLEEALRSKRPSAWKLYELQMFLQLSGDGAPAKGKKSELAER